MPTPLPNDAVGKITVGVLILSIVATSVFLFSVKRVQVGNRFLLPLRFVFAIHMTWQIHTMTYDLIEVDSYWSPIANFARVFWGTLYAAYGVSFNVMILEAFRILTNIPVLLAVGIRTVSILLAIASWVGKIMKTIYPKSPWAPFCTIVVTAGGLYSVFVDLAKSVYILRLLYLDALRINDGNSLDVLTIKKRYRDMRQIIYPVVALCALNAILWALGVVIGSEVLIAIAQSCNGIQILLYPRLIISYRKLRFDRTLAFATGVMGDKTCVTSPIIFEIPNKIQNTPNASDGLALETKKPEESYQSYQGKTQVKTQVKQTHQYQRSGDGVE